MDKAIDQLMHLADSVLYKPSCHLLDIKYLICRESPFLIQEGITVSSYTLGAYGKPAGRHPCLMSRFRVARLGVIASV